MPAIKSPKYLTIGFFVLLSLAFGAALAVYPCHADQDAGLSRGQTVYLPIHSHVYTGDRQLPFYLTATLNIRNTDLERPISVLSVDYYDSNGKLLGHYLEETKTVGPLATIEFIVKESDRGGGGGAKFIVKWESKAPVNPPIIEGVMIGARSKQGISFVTYGRPVKDGNR